MDEATSYRLKKAVESIVTSGKTSISATKLKTIEEICKSSEDNQKTLYEHIKKWLRKNHAEIRLGALQLIVEIFKQAEAFRLIVVQDLKFLFRQTILGDKSHPLPKPKDAARKMTCLSIKSLDSWCNQYGFMYPEIMFGRTFLELNVDIDFSTGCVAPPRGSLLSPDELSRETQKRIRAHRKVTDELGEWQDQIENSITEFNNAFSLLIPGIEDFIPSDSGNTDNRITEAVKDDEPKSITINFNNVRTIQETVDNEYLVESIRDQIKCMERQLLPKVRSWEKRLIKYSSFYQDLIMNIVFMKKRMKKAVAKFSSLSIVSGATDNGETDDESDGELIDVPLPEEESELSQLGLDIPKISISQRDLSEAGPSGIDNKCPRAHLKKSIDDFYDGEWAEPTKAFNSALGENPVWGSSDGLHDTELNQKPLGISTEIVHVERPFVPVDHVCRAPLPSGRLCPREDRIACPFHGKILARDEFGEPLDPEDRRREQEMAEARERENPSWQNPTLLAEIKNQTGVDLDMKKAKRRKRKFEELTDIKKTTARERLSKKVFSKRAKCKKM